MTFCSVLDWPLAPSKEAACYSEIQALGFQKNMALAQRPPETLVGRKLLRASEKQDGLKERKLVIRFGLTVSRRKCCQLGSYPN